MRACDTFRQIKNCVQKQSCAASLCSPRLVESSRTVSSCLNTPRYDKRCYFNVRSKADTSQLNYRLEIISGHRLDRLMLSVQAVRGLPHLRTPGIVPCIISTSTRLIKFKYSFYLTFCVGLYIRLAPPPMSPDGVKCLVKITKAMQLTHNVNNSCTFFR